MDKPENKYIFNTQNVHIPKSIKHEFYDIKKSKNFVKGSYLVYLPPSYDTEPQKKFPVIYFLHGGGGNIEDPIWAINNYDSAIKEEKLRELIIVAPKGTGRYIDSINPKYPYPTESIIIKDLIPFVEKKYRIINENKSRGLEGFSMGGYGVLRYGFKYPDFFGVLLAGAPSVDRNLDEDYYFIGNEFNFDQDYFEKIGPWNSAKENAEKFNMNKNKLRIIIGEDDGLLKTDYKYHKYLKELEIPHEYHLIPSAGHIYSETLSSYKDTAFEYWNENLKF